MHIAKTIAQNIQSVPFILTVLVLFAGVVGAWVRLQMRFNQLSKDVIAIEEEHAKRAAEQNQRLKEILEKSQDVAECTKSMHGDLKVQVQVLAQKFEDFIRWTKANGIKKQ